MEASYNTDGGQDTRELGNGPQVEEVDQGAEVPILELLSGNRA